MSSSREIPQNVELNSLESQVNSALSGFKGELNAIKSSIDDKKKDIELSVDDMKADLEKNKLRIQTYIKVNGATIELKDLIVDETNKMYKMTYVVALGDKSYELPSYFKIINTDQNHYLKFQVPPTKKESAADVLLEGKVYDVNVVKEKVKDVDIRIQYNEQKTLAKIMEKISAFNLKKDFDIKKDKELENTQLTGLNKVALGTEITKVEGGYSRSVFLSENKKYRDLGKVYFDEKGEVDAKKTKDANPEFKILDVVLKLNLDLTNNTFKIDNYDALKAKVLAHRAALKELISNSSVADNTIFTGFNSIGTEWTNTKNIGLSLIDDTYTVQWGGKKDEVLRFGFDPANKLSLKDLKGAFADSFVLPVTVDDEVRLYDVKKNDELTRLNIIESTAKEHQTVQELPELIDAPLGLKTENLYVFNREEGKKLEYFTADGKLVTAIPASKTETNERKLDKLTQVVDPYDVFIGYLDKFPADMLKKLNVFENDIFTIFKDAFQKAVPDFATRPVVKVLEGKSSVYYMVDQRKAGDALTFEKDEELYEEANSIITLLTQNLEALKTLSAVQLNYRDGDNVGDFLKFKGGAGGIGLLDVATADKLAFLAKDRNDKKILERKLVYSNGLLNGGKDVMSLNFEIKKDKIALEGKKKEEVTIEGQKFQIRSETDKDGKFILRFDTVLK